MTIRSRSRPNSTRADSRSTAGSRTSGPTRSSARAQPRLSPGPRIRSSSRWSTSLRVAYLTGNYPKVSHTFIAREINALRALGVEVETFSLHRPDPAELLSDEDRREAAETRNVQP